MRWPALLVFAASLACAGVPVAPPPAPVDAAAPAEECCTVDGVIRMTGSGVDPAVIVDAIYTSGTNLALTDADLTRMSAAGVAPAVMDALNGGPCECKEKPRPRPTAAPSEPQPAAAGLNVAVKYAGGRTFELTNLSTGDYTGLLLVANGTWQYRLKKLPAGSADSVRLSTFVSTQDGTELKDDLRTLFIRADQGAWSRSF